MSDEASSCNVDNEDGSLFRRRGRDAPQQMAPTGAGSQGPAAEASVEYEMKCPKRGTCIIFNQVEFDPRTRQSKRVGSDVDADSLERTFKKLGFSVMPFKDLTIAKIGSVMKSTAKADHSNHDCLAVVVLSHGENGFVYGADGPIRLDDLAKSVRPDKCPSLAGKPKLFFVQACRGTKYDAGAEVSDGDNFDDKEDKLDAATRLSRIPLESDFLFFYSTPPGYYSWRNDVEGSWFVQQLCKVFNEHGDSVELAHLLLIVQRMVAAEFQSRTGDESTSGMKQIPVSVSTLRKQLYFRRK